MQSLPRLGRMWMGVAKAKLKAELRNALGGAEAVEAVASYGSQERFVRNQGIQAPVLGHASECVASNVEWRAPPRTKLVRRDHETSRGIARYEGRRHRLKMTAALRDVLPNRSGENPFAYAASPEIVAAARAVDKVQRRIYGNIARLSRRRCSTFEGLKTHCRR